MLDGHSAAALAITRSAGRGGHWVAVGANRNLFAAAKLSRYCRMGFDYPVSTDEPNAFVNCVLEFVRKHAIDLVLPVTDWTLGPLSDQRDRFAGVCIVAMPSESALSLASDKYRTIELARSLGMEVPRSELIASAADLSPWERSEFPVVIKDRFSARWAQDRAVLGSVTYAYSAAELRAKVAERLTTVCDVLVQEFVSGTGIGFSCFAVGGKTVLPFQWQRVREIDPRGSASSARKSVPLDSSIAAASTGLILAMGFEGLAMVEYKRTTEGRVVLMEINGRPWGSIGLPLACGIDYPRCWINWSLNGTLPPEMVSYRDNLLCRRLVSELTHLANIRRGRPPNWSVPYPNFWTTLIRMAVPWRPGMCYDDLWLSDLRPGVVGISHWFRSRMRRKSGN